VRATLVLVERDVRVLEVVVLLPAVLLVLRVEPEEVLAVAVDVRVEPLLLGVRATLALVERDVRVVVAVVAVLAERVAPDCLDVLAAVAARAVRVASVAG